MRKLLVAPRTSTLAIIAILACGVEPPTAPPHRVLMPTHPLQF